MKRPRGYWQKTPRGRSGEGEEVNSLHTMRRFTYIIIDL